MDFIIRYCPNVDSIAAIGWQCMATDWPSEHPDFREYALSFFRAAARAVKLRTFQLEEDWYSCHIEEMVRAMPHLKSLIMLGRFVWDESEEMLPMLRRLPDLTDLALPDVSNLGAGFYRQATYGNAFREPGDQRQLDEEARGLREHALAATRPVAESAFQQLPGLERLWIGSSMLFTPVRDLEGARAGVDFKHEHRPTPPTLGFGTYNYAEVDSEI